MSGEFSTKARKGSTKKTVGKVTVHGLGSRGSRNYLGSLELDLSLSRGYLVISPLDDLCIDIWMYVMIIHLRTQMTKR